MPLQTTNSYRPSARSPRPLWLWLSLRVAAPADDPVLLSCRSAVCPNLNSRPQANRRVWEPWRAYLPTPHHYRYRQTVKALNEYVGNLIRERWAKHQSGAKIEKEDILDRVLKSLVRPPPFSRVPSCPRSIRHVR